MCGRYAYSHDPDVVSSEFSVVKILPTREELDKLHNLAPKMTAPIVFNDHGVRTLDNALWSLVPTWSKDGKPGDFSTFNARDDGLLTSKLYAKPFRESRCIVPARGFYEWQGKKMPKPCFYMHRADNLPLGMAGLMSLWEPKNGGKPVRSFTIITTDPNYMMEKIHHRMPVILDINDYDIWLDSDNHDTAALSKLLRPCPEDVLFAHEIAGDSARAGGGAALKTAPKPKRPRKPKPDNDETGFLF